jgi:hypothetical protein
VRHQRDIEHGAGYAPVPTSLEHERYGAAREFRCRSCLALMWSVLIQRAVAAFAGTPIRVGWIEP